ncbi:MAG: hypothetical protein IPM23_26915 [Candidatus Melainabacteria bacterium]|nr:hypothetical protein [Candidatus Melainabacteria bacterium]
MTLFSFSESVALVAAILSVLMVGSGNLRTNLLAYALSTAAIALVAGLRASILGESHLLLIAFAMVAIKALWVPWFLSRILDRIRVYFDPGTVLAIPIAMHTGIVLMGISYLLAGRLPLPVEGDPVTGSTTASISLLFTGALFMLTRKTAVSQVVGFLTMENGIFLFALTMARGMPLIVEMGVLLDVLVAVMIAGLITFKIQKSFEHIDVTRLTDLRE